MNSVPRASVAFACLFALVAMPGCQVVPSPFASAQSVVLQGPIATFVSQFATETGIRLVPITAGTFTMGSPENELGRFPNEGPQTRVTLTKDFFLAATAVTQGQYEAVTGTNPSHFKAVGKDAPVENISWDNAMAFCQKLTVREKAAGRLPPGWQLTLPTEAQWEYACRAGTTGPYAGDLDAMSWYSKNSGNMTHPVGTKQPNAWGLYDMHGNVVQWCADWFGSYPGGAISDPTGPTIGTDHDVRGGGYDDGAASCRSALRSYLPSRASGNAFGFRLALSPVRESPVAMTPVEKDGLSVVVEPLEKSVSGSGSFKVKVTYRNVSKAAFRLANQIVFHSPGGLEYDSGGAFVELKLQEVATGKTYTSIDLTSIDQRLNLGLVVSAGKTIQPGDTQVRTVALDGKHFQLDVPEPDKWPWGMGFIGPTGGSASGVGNYLPPGDYKVTVIIRFPVKPAPDNDPTPLWKGDSIEATPMEVTLTRSG